MIQMIDFAKHIDIVDFVNEIKARSIVGKSAASQASRRIRMKIKRDKKLKKRIRRVENKLNLSRV